jgi:hypothetical protein
MCVREFCKENYVEPHVRIWSLYFFFFFLFNNFFITFFNIQLKEKSFTPIFF